MRGAGCSQDTGWESHLGKVMEGLCKAKHTALKEAEWKSPRTRFQGPQRREKGTGASDTEKTLSRGP